MSCVSADILIDRKTTADLIKIAIAINPKDTNTFASACLDKTVKIWSLGSSTANFTLEAHTSKVSYWPDLNAIYSNCVGIGRELGRLLPSK
jgi:WD40 repeat protein